MTYSIDTSAFAEAWVRYYPPDVFPTLWTRFDELIEQGGLVAIDEVLHELEKKKDDLYAWAQKRPGLFVPLDKPIIDRAKAIINQFPSLTDPKKMRGTADPFVIALAMERQITVLTAEQRSRPSRESPMCAGN